MQFFPSGFRSFFKIEKTSKFRSLLQQIPRSWNREDFVLCGSACLAVRGIRDVNDLDILVHPHLMDEVRTLPNVSDGGYVISGQEHLRMSLNIDIFDRPPRIGTACTFEDIKASAEAFEGYYVQSLRHTLAIKALALPARKKDQLDMLKLASLILKEEDASKSKSWSSGPYR